MGKETSDSIPAEARISETHEYILTEQLGDIVYVELPEVGQVLDKGDTFGSIESVKAASDLYMPVSGEIIAVNTQLSSEMELINDDPYGDGWIIEVTLSKPEELDGLMESKQYVKFLEEAVDV
jgi:glycine cleavage system H protein